MRSSVARVQAWLDRPLGAAAAAAPAGRAAPRHAGILDVAAVLAIAGLGAALVLSHDRVRSFDSLADMYAPLTSVGLYCAPPPPVRSDPVTGRDSVLCSTAEGSLALLELSDSAADAERAVSDAHATSERAAHYASVSGDVPVEPGAVLLGSNWTILANAAVLDRVATELGGTIYPYPERP